MRKINEEEYVKSLAEREAPQSKVVNDTTTAFGKTMKRQWAKPKLWTYRGRVLVTGRWMTVKNAKKQISLFERYWKGGVGEIGLERRFKDDPRTRIKLGG